MSLSEAAANGIIDRVREGLTENLPGWLAQSRMAPEFRESILDDALESSRNRHAAVLILLYPQEHTLFTAFTVRKETLTHHAGQISFPGGRIDRDETPVEAALREAWEEVGIEPISVEVLGKLSPLYIPPSDFWVHPFVGTMASAPDWRPHTNEVKSIIEVPISHLQNEANRKTEKRKFGKEKRTIPYFAVGKLKIWGATAMITSELLAVLEEAEQDDPDDE